MASERAARVRWLAISKFRFLYGLPTYIFKNEFVPNDSGSIKTTRGCCTFLTENLPPGFDSRTELRKNQFHFIIYKPADILKTCPARS